MPAVSFLKAPGYQDAHAGYSDPLDEQTFVVTVINFLHDSSADWDSTAVFITYDDSDGWYDHQLGPIVNQSTTGDALTGNGQCGTGTAALPGPQRGTTHAQGRCGYGPRIPLMVISPWAKANFVDHTLTDQTSIIRFIEDNWLRGQRIGRAPSTPSPARWITCSTSTTYISRAVFPQPHHRRAESTADLFSNLTSARLCG